MFGNSTLEVECFLAYPSRLLPAYHRLEKAMVYSQILFGLAYSLSLSTWVIWDYLNGCYFPPLLCCSPVYLGIGLDISKEIQTMIILGRSS